MEVIYTLYCNQSIENLKYIKFDEILHVCKLWGSLWPAVLCQAVKQCDYLKMGCEMLYRLVKAMEEKEYYYFPLLWVFWLWFFISHWSLNENDFHYPLKPKLSDNGCNCFTCMSLVWSCTWISEYIAAIASIMIQR